MNWRPNLMDLSIAAAQIFRGGKKPHFQLLWEGNHIYIQPYTNPLLHCIDPIYTGLLNANF